MQSQNSPQFTRAVPISAPAPAYTSFLLLSDPTADPVRPRFIRCKCELTGNVLIGYNTRAVAPNDPSDPYFVLKLAECLRVEPEPHSIEESVEKMRLRKKSKQFLAFRLFRHVHRIERGKPRKKAGKIQFWPEQYAELVFKAEAGGDVNLWLKHLRRAMWWTQASMIFHTKVAFAIAATCETNSVVKLLLDRVLHPESAKVKSKRIVDAHIRVESRNTFPRAILLNVDDTACTPAMVKLQAQEQLGLAAYCMVSVEENYMLLHISLDSTYATYKVLYNVPDGKRLDMEEQPLRKLKPQREADSRRFYMIRMQYQPKHKGALFMVEEVPMKNHFRHF